METMNRTLVLFAAALSCVAAQKAPVASPKPPKEVQVTAQATGQQRRVIDLTRAGTLYTLAAGVDHNRVVVHTAKGDMTVAELLKKAGKTVNGVVRVGMTSDIRAYRANVAGGIRSRGGLNYDCSGLSCVCTGDDDCNDLFTSGKCGPISVCYPDGCVCLRL